MATDLRRPPAALDSGSFDRFYRRHLGEIYRFVLQDVGNRADAEEVTQTAFLDAFRALRRGHEPAMPRAWMYGIARNAARRRFRTLSRRPREVELGPAVVEELAEPEEGPRVDAIRSAFGELKPNHREVLFLREVEGLSYAEIAERMRMSRPAVETLLFRARRSLREHFEVEGLRPAVRPSRVKSLKGLALLPMVFLNRLSDRVQHLVSPELATKTAGAVTAVALGTGVVIGTQTLRGEATTAKDDSARPASVAPAGGLLPSDSVRVEYAAAPARPKAEHRGERDRKSARGDGKRPSDDKTGKPDKGGDAGGGSGGSSGGGSGGDGGGGSLTTPPVSVPAVTLPPVDIPVVPVPPVAIPPVEVPPVEVPPVEVPPVEVPPVEIELPVDPGELIGG